MQNMTTITDRIPTYVLSYTLVLHTISNKRPRLCCTNLQSSKMNLPYIFLYGDIVAIFGLELLLISSYSQWLFWFFQSKNTTPLGSNWSSFSSGKSFFFLQKQVWMKACNNVCHATQTASQITNPSSWDGLYPICSYPKVLLTPHKVFTCVVILPHG